MFAAEDNSGTVTITIGSELVSKPLIIQFQEHSDDRQMDCYCRRVFRASRMPVKSLGVMVTMALVRHYLLNN